MNNGIDELLGDFGSDTFGGWFIPLIGAVGAALGAAGGYFGWRASKEERHEAQAQLPLMREQARIAYMQSQADLMRQQMELQQKQQEQKKWLLYGGLGLGALLLLKKL